VLERICIPPTEPAGTQFDLGLIGEALLFYGETFLVVAGNSLPGLVRQVGPDVLFRLIDEHQLRVRFIDHTLGAITTNKGTHFARYDVGLIRAEKYSLETAATNAFVEVTGKSGRGRRLASRFCRSVEPIEYADSITKRITEDMERGIYLEEFIKRRLVSLGAIRNLREAPNFSYKFSLDPGKGFILDTDLNIGKRGERFAEIADPASILAQYGTTVANMSLWAQLSSEVAVYPRQADVIAARLEPMLAAFRQEQEILSAYLDFVLDDSKAVREAINSGDRNLGELVPILERAQQFKSWLSGLPDSKDLIKQYHKEVTADSWIDRLPGKSTRWMMFAAAGLGIDASGAGGVGTAAGVALSALDTFFLDRLLKGWKPHQFVEGALRKFVDHET
jgi:hypothetical protein